MRALKTAFSLIVMAWLGAVAAYADEPEQLVVVELYTSQGCNSCPPADELLSELSHRADVLPLALHVDYWDYIGWADTFARPEYTKRQKAYAHEAGHRSIYTPQMVVAGVDHVIGYKPMKLADLLAAHESDRGQVGIDAQLSGSRLSVRVWPQPGVTLPGKIVIDLVGFSPVETVAIERGENAGRTITYANIVRNWDRVGRWNGRGEWQGALADVPADTALALIVQEDGPGRILCAIRLR